MGAACGPTDESQAEPRVRHLASLTRLLARLRGDKQARRPSYTRPNGRSALIIDDAAIDSLSRKGSPSQAELCNRLCGHVSSHHNGGLSVFVATQTFVAVPPSIRRLMSHWFLFPNRISRECIPQIAKGVMIEKGTMGTLFDWCKENPYDFIL